MPAGGLVTAGIGAGASLIGGLFGKNASKKAGQIQSDNAQKVAGMATAAGDKASSMALSAGDAAAAGVKDAASAGAGLVTDASGKAIDTVNKGTGDANDILKTIFGGESDNLASYLALGQQGTQGFSDALKPGGSLAGTFSFDPSKIADDPGYQFANQQGQQAILRAAAAQGKTISGDTLKSLTQFGAGNATQYENQFFNQSLQGYQANRSNTLSALLGAIGIGQNATGQANQAAQNYGNQVAGNTLQASIYGGNTLQNTASYLSGLGVDSAKYAGTTQVGTNEFAGNAGLQAAQIAGSALTGGANAQAAGVVGGANAINGALGGVANAATMYNLQKIYAPYPGTQPMNIPIDRTSAGVGPSAVSGYPMATTWPGSFIPNPSLAGGYN